MRRGTCESPSAKCQPQFDSIRKPITREYRFKKKVFKIAAPALKLPDVAGCCGEVGLGEEIGVLLEGQKVPQEFDSLTRFEMSGTKRAVARLLH